MVLAVPLVCTVSQQEMNLHCWSPPRCLLWLSGLGCQVECAVLLYALVLRVPQAI